MAESRFVHATFIHATSHQVWDALMGREFARGYWAGVTPISPILRRSFDACAWEFGRIVVSNAPRRLVLTWRNVFLLDMQAEGFSRLAFEIESARNGVELTLTHEIAAENSLVIAALGRGWPAALADLRQRVEICACMPFIPQTAERIIA